MRKQITLYDDQYAFYKELKSEKLLVAFVEYMFEDVKPQWLNSLEQTIRNSLVVRMDNLKKKSVAWSKSRWWGRPKKTTDITTENKEKKQQKNNTKTTEKQQVKVEDKDKVKDKVKENINNNLSPIGDNSEAETYWNQEINNLISELKEECNHLGVAYEKKDERNFAKHILTAKDYWDFAEKIWQNRIEFAKNVLRASLKIGFFKWICAWPKPIYQNYAEVYNETMKTKSKAKTIPKF